MSAKLSLLKRGWHEVPHLMLGGSLFLCGSIVAVYKVYRHIKYEHRRFAWKKRYVVVREEEFNPNKQIYPLDKKTPYF